MIAAAQVQHLRTRWKEMEPVLNEQSRRRWAATEAKALGRGGVSCVVRVTGFAGGTVSRDRDDIRRRHKPGLGRIRKRGGGRKPKIVHDPTLLKDLKTLVEPATRGDPMKSLLWTSRSLRKLSKELANKGHEVSHTVVGELLQKAGYSLQANRKTREGNQHMDRDAQFQYINARAASFLKDGQPVVSVDTKKKELVGNFKNAGREWRPQDSPEDVNVHDFIDQIETRGALRRLRYSQQHRLGQRGNRSRHGRFCGQRHSQIVAYDGEKTLCEPQRSYGDGRWRRLQRLSRAVVENRIAEISQRTQIPDHGLPSAAGHQQVEQNRASALFVRHDQLARQAFAKLSRDHSAHRHHDDRDRTEGARGAR